MVRPNITSTFNVVYFVRGEQPRFIQLGYEYEADDETDRLFEERETLRTVLDGLYAKHKYPIDFGKNHLAVWRGINHCVVCTDGDGIISLKDEDIGPVINDFQVAPTRFLPVWDELLLRYLNTNEDLQNEESDPERVQVIEQLTRDIGMDLFRRLREFVVREGQSFKVQSLPPEIPHKERGLCHLESLQLQSRSDLVYVEGFAISYRAKIAMLHGWCIDKDERVVDCTWNNGGVAYFGVPICQEYAGQRLEQFKGMPVGSTTASLLNDPTNNWEILNGQARDWKLMIDGALLRKATNATQTTGRIMKDKAFRQAKKLVQRCSSPGGAGRTSRLRRKRHTWIMRVRPLFTTDGITLTQLKKFFSFTPHRRRLVTHLMDEIRSAEQSYDAVRLWLFGSFLTEKNAPGDIDVLLTYRMALQRIVTQGGPTRFQRTHTSTVQILSHGGMTMLTKEEMVGRFNNSDSNLQNGIQIASGNVIEFHPHS